jgi:predicted transposase YdaD
LSSQVPEVVLLAILSNYQIEQAETILRLIIENLKKLEKNKRVLKKYINQLMMISRLRKIEALTIKISEEMSINIDYETDTLYLRGAEKGIEKGIEEGIAQKDKLIVKNLLLDTDFSNERIALLADVSIDYVQKMRLELAQKK